MFGNVENVGKKKYLIKRGKHMYNKLRPYQQEDVDRIVQNKIIGNFSEQRTGKTPTACVALKEAGCKRVLIVCPASLIYVWKEEYEYWAESPAVVIKSTAWDKKQFKDEVCYIVNYDKIRGFSKKQQLIETLSKVKFDAVVLDEAHRMKNRTSLTAGALRKVRNVPIKIAITGTPAPNKPWDVWTILNWLFPNTYSSYWRFINEYFEEEKIFVNGTEHTSPTTFRLGMDKILQMNLDVICIQHKRKDVMPWAENDTVPTIVKLPCSPRQQKAIDSLMEFFEYKHIITQGVLDNLIRVRQLCAAPAILNIKAPSPKIEWLLEYVADYPEKSILVFSNSKKFLKLISKKLSDSKIKHTTICGDVPLESRQHIVKNFQKETIKLLLCQTVACKEGLTLDQADVSIFLDTYPPASGYSQAKDRMVATTKDRAKPKEIIHVMMKDTYDEVLYNLVSKNISETGIINDYKSQLSERRKKHGK